MKYSEFCESVKEEVTRMMGETYSVRLETITKNNQVSYEAIVISKSGVRISPTIYLEGYYKDYMAGKNIPDISLAIVVQYEMSKNECNVDLTRIMDYQSMKEQLYVRAINTAMNQQKLKSMPHMDYYNLSMVVYAELEETPGYSAIMPVENQHLAIWDITEEELFAQAIENTRTGKPYTLKKMSDVLRGMLDKRMNDCEYKKGDDEELDAMVDDAKKVIEDTRQSEMYILTNSEAYCGAVYMLFDDYMEQIVDQIGEDIYILPGSIHELILVPKSVHGDGVELSNMVKTINRNDMDPRDILSDEIYLYERGKGIVIE